ncbi:hypothetical protein GOODEAATRI_000118 [Goodea atripinnis]|uniref:UBL3-like ubiquitin domain-containing protein n=1 Tax=Goodea atripinnis TaxID=208336 RepID=A0ABV0PJM7_9TELE
MPVSSKPSEGHLVPDEVRGSGVVHLRLILVSGKTQDFTFSPNDSATDIAKHVFDNWPAALKLPPGRTTVMHLVARETLPEPNSHGEDLLILNSGSK